MRLTLDPLTATGDAIPVTGSAGIRLDLWTALLDWPCRDRRLRLRLIGAEPLAIPVHEPSEPLAGALARAVHAIAGRGALAMLENPGEALGVERIALAEGVRLFAIGGETDEACWDALLSLGQPTYGVRGRLRVDVMRATPAAVVSALAFGVFTAEDGLELTSLAEDRAGVRYVSPDLDTSASVIVRHGFEAQRLSGPSGAYADRGNEAYVRLVVRSPRGSCWTQPRFVAPRAGPPRGH